MSRWGQLFRRRERMMEELDQEIRDFIERETEDNIARGMAPEEARHAALRKFGNVAQVQEETWEVWSFVWLEQFWQDFRYGVRMLAKNPGFTVVAVLTLALGIGANTAIFSLIDGVMLRALPVRDPSRLVVMRWTAHAEPHHVGTVSFGDCARSGEPGKDHWGCPLPYPFFESVRAEKQAFSSATAFAGFADLVLSGNGVARMARGELVSGDYFSTLGVTTFVGRTLGPADDSPSAQAVVVLSYPFWQDTFGGDRSVIGRTIVLNSVPFTIVGVADPNFTSLTPGKTQDLFLTLSKGSGLNIPWGSAPEDRTLKDWWLVVVARLKPEVTLERAQAAATLLFRDQMLNGGLMKAADDPRIILTSAQSGLNGGRSRLSMLLYILMFAVGLVLLIACANIAGLLLSRASARQKEMAVRMALGAGRLRTVRQLLTESITLSLAGGVLGVLVAIWGVPALITLLPNSSDGPFPYAVEPDWRVLGFTIAITIGAGIVFGLAPALRSTRVNLTPALKQSASALQSGARHAGRRFSLGDALVAIQVALSIMVLVGAGLVVRTLGNLRAVNPGFDTSNLLLFNVNPWLQKYSDSRIQGLYRHLQEQLGALPGVLSVSYSSDSLLSGGLWTEDVHVEGQAAKSTAEVDMLAVGPDFHKTLRIPVLEGRVFTGSDFTEADQAAAVGQAQHSTATPSNASSATKSAAPAVSPVAVLVNASFVHTYFAGQNPLGKRVTEGGDSEHPKITKIWEIIGVTGDTKYNDLRREIHPTIYVPRTGGRATFELRTAMSPQSVIPAVRKIVGDADKDLPVFGIHTQTQRIDELVIQERLIARLGSCFGGLALLLACVGLYGLLSYEVARRTREIGIRMALGAARANVLRGIAAQGLRITIIGIAAGIVGGIAVTRYLSSLLFGLKSSDPLTYAGVSLILIAVALVACYIPARRATKVDPMVALRCE